MSNWDEKFLVPEWYEELQEIREKLALENKHFKRIKEFESLNDSPLPAKDRIPIVEVINAMTFSYPVLVKNHLKEWESLRAVCQRLAEWDKVSFVEYFRACAIAVFDERALGVVGNAADEDIGYYTAPFDYMDRVITLKENKYEMPFKLLDYEDEQLLPVLEMIKAVNIREVIENWLKEHPNGVYPDVLELYRAHEKYSSWFPLN